MKGNHTTSTCKCSSGRQTDGPSKERNPEGTHNSHHTVTPQCTFEMRRAHRLVTEEPSLSLTFLQSGQRTNASGCDAAIVQRHDRQGHGGAEGLSGRRAAPAAWMTPNYICHCQTTFPHRKWGDTNAWDSCAYAPMVRDKQCFKSNFAAISF